MTGFSSATPKKEVALEYSGALSCKGPKCSAWNKDKGFCEHHRSTILEISTGQIDRGASLKWVSQFPAEDEHVLLPLCNFEVVGMRREIFHAADGEEKKKYDINVLEIKLNLNLNARTLEELRESRKTIAIDFARGLLQDSEGLLSGNELISMDQVETKLMKICDIPADHFNEIHNFRAQINDLFKHWQSVMEDSADKLKNHAQSLLESTDVSAKELDQKRIGKALEQATEIYRRLNKKDKVKELNTLQISTANSKTSDMQMAKMLAAQGDLKSIDSALALVKEKKSVDAQRIVPVMCKQKGDLLLQKIWQKIEDGAALESNDQADIENALESLALGLKQAEDQRVNETGTTTHFSLIRADILQDVGALMLKCPGEISDVSLRKFQSGAGGVRETSASGLLQESLTLKIETLGLDFAVSESITLLNHLAVLAAREGHEDEASVSADQSALLCRARTSEKVFETLSKRKIGAFLPQQAHCSNAKKMLNVAEFMESIAAADSTAASSCKLEWGVRAIFSLFKSHGRSAVKNSPEYKFNDNKMSWQAHQDAAITWGGHLTSINSKEEQQHILDLCKGYQDCCWIGAKRKGTGNGPDGEHWEWCDGSPWTFTYWAPGEPNNAGGNEDRVTTWNELGQWNDIRQDWQRGVGVYKKQSQPLALLQFSEATMVIRALTSTARAHKRNTALSQELCKTLMPALQELRNATTGDVGDLAKAIDQAVSMLVAVLDVHKDNLAVRSHALHALRYMVCGRDAVSKATLQQVANSGGLRVIVKLLDAVDFLPGECIDEKDRLAVFEMVELFVSDAEAGKQFQNAIAVFNGHELLKAAMNTQSRNASIEECGKRILDKCNESLERAREKREQIQKKSEKFLKEAIQERIEQQKLAKVTCACMHVCVCVYVCVYACTYLYIIYVEVYFWSCGLLLRGIRPQRMHRSRRGRGRGHGMSKGRKGVCASMHVARFEDVRMMCMICGG